MERLIGRATLVICSAASLALCPPTGSPRQIRLLFNGTETLCDGPGRPCVVGEQVRFQPLSIAGVDYIPDPDCESLTWDFGDGTTPVAWSGGFASHAYAMPGSFRVTATAKNALGTSVSSATITVDSNSCPIRPPSSGVSIAVSGNCVSQGKAIPMCLAGEAVRFTATFPQSPEACDVLAWQFDDGTVAGGADVAHRFTSGQYHTVDFSWTNSRGHAQTRAVVYIVAPRHRAARH